MLRNPAEHAARRRPWTRAFSTAAIQEYKPQISKRVAQLIEGLAASRGSVDLTSWISWFTYDFMNDMVYALLIITEA